MSIAQALREGAGQLRAARRVVFILYAATAAAALLASTALMSVAWESLGHSAWAPRMLENFDLEWAAEVAAQYGSAAMPIVYITLFVLAAFAVAYLFLTGGVLEVLCAGGASFFGGCGKYFWRLARLALWSGICAIAPLLAGGLLRQIGTKVWGDGSAATPLVYWGWFRMAVALGGLGVVNLAFDYAAIGMAAADSRQSLRALRDGFRFIFRHPRKTLALYGALWAVLALVVGLGSGISRLATPRSMAAVVALFLFRQTAVLAKTWCWLLFFPAQAAMWRALRPAAAVAAEPAMPGDMAVVAAEPALEAAEGETLRPPELTP
jgi:hypothetical protein